MPILRSRRLEEPRRNAMAKTTATEVNSDPDTILLIHEYIDIVVTAADGSELRMRLMTQRSRGLSVPAFVRIVDEGRIIVTLRILPADAKRERIPDVVHDARDIGANFRARDVETHGLVAAGNIKADSSRADAILRSDDAANRNAIAKMTVGHKRHVIGASERKASPAPACSLRAFPRQGCCRCTA